MLNASFIGFVFFSLPWTRKIQASNPSRTAGWEILKSHRRRIKISHIKGAARQLPDQKKMGTQTKAKCLLLSSFYTKKERSFLARGHLSHGIKWMLDPKPKIGQHWTESWSSDWTTTSGDKTIAGILV